MEKSTLSGGIMGATTITAIITAISLTAAAPAFAVGSGQNGHRPHAALNFADLDTNGDGKITRDEISAQRAAHFSAQDTNGDGQLSEAEVSAAAIARMQDRLSKRFAKMLQRRDANGDGQLSLAEVTDSARSAKLFDKMDANNDGSVSRDELKKMQTRRAARSNRNGQSNPATQ